MNLTALVADLKRDEGFRGLAYDDATGGAIKAGSILVGAPTIGYGWNLSSDPIGETEATDRLRKRAVEAMRDAADLVPSWLGLSDVRQNVLANMAYNLGKQGLAAFHDLLAAVEAKDWTKAGAAILDSKAARQAPARYGRLSKEMATDEAI